MVDTSMSPLLGLGIATSSAISGYQEGKEQAISDDRAKQKFSWERDAAMQRKQQGEYKLAEMGRQERLAKMAQPLQEQALQQQLQVQSQQLAQQGRAMFKADTYKAIDYYLENYDTKHLNNLVQEAKQNPYAPQTFKDVVRVEDININSDSDLKALGINKQELDALDGQTDGKIDWDLAQKRYKKIIKPDGSVELRDILTVAAFAGYGRYAQERNLERLKTMSDIKYKQAKADKSAQGPQATYTSRDAAEYAMLKQKRDNGTASPTELSRLAWFEQEQGGTEVAKTQKQVEASEAIRSKMNLPYQEFRNDPEVRKLVADIRMQRPLTTQAQKELQDLADLSSALTGNYGAVNLTTEQTGIIDTFVGKLDRKITEDFDTRAKNSYGAFINKFRNNLFGATLTDGELEAFEKAYSTDSDKLGPVLSGLRAAASQLKARFDAIAMQNDEAIIKYDTGLVGADLERAIQNIDSKINQLEAIAEGKAPIQDQQSKSQAQPPSEAKPTQPQDLKTKYGF